MTNADPEHRMSQSSLDQPQIAATAEAGWFERFLPRSRSKAVFIFTITCYTFTLSAIAGRLIRLFGASPTPNINYRTSTVLDTVVGPLVFAPVVESFIVIGLIELVRRLRFNVAIQIAISVSINCFLHSFSEPFWGLAVAPGFLIGAAAYIYWRRVSFWIGAQTIILLHFFYNAIVFTGVLADWLHR